MPTTPQPKTETRYWICWKPKFPKSPYEAGNRSLTTYAEAQAKAELKQRRRSKTLDYWMEKAE